MDKTMLKFRIEGLKRKAKELAEKVAKAVKQVALAVVEFAKKYPLEFATMLVAAAGGGMKLIRRHDNQKAIKAEETKRERQIYDRSEGHYWTLKRKPKAEEWGEINFRKRNGEGYYEILTDMGLVD